MVLTLGSAIAVMLICAFKAHDLIHLGLTTSFFSHSFQIIKKILGVFTALVKKQNCCPHNFLKIQK